MVAASVFTVEDVVVVNPDMRVGSVKLYVVVHAAHDGKIAVLNTRRVTCHEAEAAYCSIVADTLEGHIHYRVSLLALHLNTV